MVNFPETGGSDCVLNLPVTKDIQWGTIQQDFIDKGYKPSRFAADDLSSLTEGSLVANLNLNYEAKTGLGSKSTCTFKLGMDEVTKVNPLKLATLFTISETQKTLNLFSSSVKCENAMKKVLRSFPKCEIK
ncbi:MAG TPA: hypothetical protein VNJ08_17040 [Bacteriovoracaceae bacterium]|nr:hypothetical protein [Bacteriovoracaceae bacterium]